MKVVNNIVNEDIFPLKVQLIKAALRKYTFYSIILI